VEGTRWNASLRVHEASNECGHGIDCGVVKVDFFDEADGELIVGKIDVLSRVDAGMPCSPIHQKDIAPKTATGRAKLNVLSRTGAITAVSRRGSRSFRSPTRLISLWNSGALVYLFGMSQTLEKRVEELETSLPS